MRSNWFVLVFQASSWLLWVNSLVLINFLRQVFCGKIPRDIYEHDLIPLFEKCGKIWDLRLMMDPMTGMNRGYAFVTFTTRDEANEAVRQVEPPLSLSILIAIDVTDKIRP